jgi:hypothetical protein
MTKADAIKSYIVASSSDVFLRSEFAGLGSERQVSRALRSLLEAGLLVRLSVGIYAKAKLSSLNGKPIPVRPLTVLAPEVLEKLGIVVFPSQAVQEYNEGRSTQVPHDNVINTGTRRVRRRLSFGEQIIKYERTAAMQKDSSTSAVTLADLAQMVADGTLDAYLTEHGVPDFENGKPNSEPRKFGERVPFDRSNFDYDAYVAEIERQLKADKAPRLG